MSSRLRPVVALLVVGLLVVACNAGSDPTPASPSTAVATPSASTGPVKLIVGLGYIPSVQFAPFYLADQAGLLRGGRPRGRVPEQDRPEPRDAGRPGRDRRRDLRRDERHPGGQPGHPGPVRRDDLRRSSRRSCSRRPRRASPPRPTSRARRSASRAATARRGSCSRRCSPSAGLTPDDLTIVEYPDFGQGAAVAAGAVACRDRLHRTTSRSSSS